jgi:hypothetical protein
MKYDYLLTFELEILHDKNIKFFCTELITKEEKKEVDDFFDFGDNTIDLTYSLGILSSDREFVIDVPPISTSIKKVSHKFATLFMSTYNKRSIGSFSLINLIKNERRSHMDINIGDSVIFREGTERYSKNTVLKVQARLGNIIYIKDDPNPYTMEMFRKPGQSIE